LKLFECRSDAAFVTSCNRRERKGNKKRLAGVLQHSLMRRFNMKNRILVAAAFSALTLLGAAAPAMARSYYSYSAPPALQVEIQPAFRSGYLWIPGFWDWRASRYYWVPGSYVRERRGYSYRHHNWRSDNGRWVLDRGGWYSTPRGHHDRDRDGVSNRNDRHPNNPYRR
jgi:hypothetical protein